MFLYHFRKRDSAKLMARYIRSTFAQDQKYISQYVQILKDVGKILDMPTLLLCIFKPKTDKIQN